MRRSFVYKTKAFKKFLINFSDTKEFVRTFEII